METTSPKKGRIIAIIFLAIIILPACYALIKEFFLKRSGSPAIETIAPDTVNTH